MSSRQKRSSGGYGLRKKAAKKKLDDDFEYYFSKMNVPIPSPTPPKPVKQRDSKYNEDIGVMSKDIHPTSPPFHREKPRNDDPLSPRKQRGRPRKRPLEEGMIAVQSPPHIYTSPVKSDSIKLKKIPKVKHIIQTEETEVEEHYAPENIVETVVVECMQPDEREECEKDSLVDEMHRIKFESVNVKIEREMREEHMLVEEVVPMSVTVTEEHEQDGEKENQPQEVVEESVIIQAATESDEMIVKLTPTTHLEEEGELEEGEDPELEEMIVKSSPLPRARRKYKRPKLSHATIARLSELHPEDKIECNECHKLLKPSSFRQHLRTHTGIKPFGCEVCEARFTRKGDVERHVRIVHHKQKPFKCCRCQRAFGDKKNLRWHLMNHDKKLFYVCEVCGFKFGKREYWENHVRFIHPVQMDVSGLVDEEGVEDDEEHGMEGGRGDIEQSRIGVIIGEEDGEVDDPLGNEEEEQAAAVSNIRVSSYAVHDGEELEDVEYVPGNIEKGNKLRGVTMITKKRNQKHNQQQQHIVKLNVGELASSNSQKGSITRRVLSMADLVQMTTRTTGSLNSGDEKGASEYVIQDQEHGGIEAVVIRFDEDDGMDDDHSTPHHHIVTNADDVGEDVSRSDNLIHVYTSEVSDLVGDSDGQQPVVIDTREYEHVGDSSTSERKGGTIEVQEVSSESNIVEVRVSGEDMDAGEVQDGSKANTVVETVSHTSDEQAAEGKGSPPKVISIVLKGDEESGLIGRRPSGDANQAVQTLIEALLDAAKDDSQRPGLVEAPASNDDTPKDT
ncbi:uncharacterized protein LOC124169527 isoform X1 [Ischnura elegans]|uniref:uncharacterized protein LOC124169527 isoform X1 n=1 Tax=Ischnura elegans TaxID=197161 RepID=UPI001ED8767D|nr:uncharacterized protein LOC124169527 isoform X1 [Ischnura elegans]